MGTPRFWLVSTTQPEPKQRNAGWRGKGAGATGTSFATGMTIRGVLKGLEKLRSN